jgi:hypothetical protein
VRHMTCATRDSGADLRAVMRASIRGSWHYPIQMKASKNHWVPSGRVSANAENRLRLKAT